MGGTGSQGEVRGAKTVVVSISVEGVSSSFHVGRIKDASVCRQLPVAWSLAYFVSGVEGNDVVPIFAIILITCELMGGEGKGRGESLHLDDGVSRHEERTLFAKDVPIVFWVQ